MILGKKYDERKNHNFQITILCTKCYLNNTQKHYQVMNDRPFAVRKLWNASQRPVLCQYLNQSFLPATCLSLVVQLCRVNESCGCTLDVHNAPVSSYKIKVYAKILSYEQVKFLYFWQDCTIASVSKMLLFFVNFIKFDRIGAII